MPTSQETAPCQTVKINELNLKTLQALQLAQLIKSISIITQKKETEFPSWSNKINALFHCCVQNFGF